MNEIGLWLICVTGAYLVGSIPFGLLLGKVKGVDIRTFGSGNVGATNAGRVLGRRWGVLCFLLDVAKGAAPVLAYGLATGLIQHGGRADAGGGVGGGHGSLAALAWLSIAAGAVMGHVFSLWLGLKGGKGVATSLGALLGLWPVLTVPAVIAVAVWVVVVKATGYVSVASMIAAVVLPLLALVSVIWHHLSGEEAGVYVAVTAALAALVIFRHRSNIVRLRQGRESKVGRGVRGEG